MTDFEFYETPSAFTRWLFSEIRIVGTVFEPCVGSGAICGAAYDILPWQARANGDNGLTCRTWVTNDLDRRWQSDMHKDATDILHGIDVDWTVSNPPFTLAIKIISNALIYSRVGVAMHLRASIHEVLKTGIRRTWMAQHPPTGILWLPRFAYQRSKTTGKWTTDSVGACWCVWLKDPAAPQFIKYAPESVIDALDAETPDYRKRMDALMRGYERV